MWEVWLAQPSFSSAPPPYDATLRIHPPFRRHDDTCVVERDRPWSAAVHDKSLHVSLVPDGQRFPWAYPELYPGHFHRGRLHPNTEYAVWCHPRERKVSRFALCALPTQLIYAGGKIHRIALFGAWTHAVAAVLSVRGNIACAARRLLQVSYTSHAPCSFILNRHGCRAYTWACRSRL